MTEPQTSQNRDEALQNLLNKWKSENTHERKFKRIFRKLIGASEDKKSTDYKPTDYFPNIPPDLLGPTSQETTKNAQTDQDGDSAKRKSLSKRKLTMGGGGDSANHSASTKSSSSDKENINNVTSSRIVLPNIPTLSDSTVVNSSLQQQHQSKLENASKKSTTTTTTTTIQQKIQEISEDEESDREQNEKQRKACDIKQMSSNPIQHSPIQNVSLTSKRIPKISYSKLPTDNHQESPKEVEPSQPDQMEPEENTLKQIKVSNKNVNNNLHSTCIESPLLTKNRQKSKLAKIKETHNVVNSTTQENFNVFLKRRSANVSKLPDENLDQIAESPLDVDEIVVGSGDFNPQQSGVGNVTQLLNELQNMPDKFSKKSSIQIGKVHQANKPSSAVFVEPQLPPAVSGSQQHQMSTSVISTRSAAAGAGSSQPVKEIEVELSHTKGRKVQKNNSQIQRWINSVAAKQDEVNDSTDEREMLAAQKNTFIRRSISNTTNRTATNMTTTVNNMSNASVLLTTTATSSKTSRLVGKDLPPLATPSLAKASKESNNTNTTKLSAKEKEKEYDFPENKENTSQRSSRSRTKRPSLETNNNNNETTATSASSSTKTKSKTEIKLRDSKKTPLDQQQLVAQQPPPQQQQPLAKPTKSKSKQRVASGDKTAQLEDEIMNNLAMEEVQQRQQQQQHESTTTASARNSTKNFEIFNEQSSPHKSAPKNAKSKTAENKANKKKAEHTEAVQQRPTTSKAAAAAPTSQRSTRAKSQKSKLREMVLSGGPSNLVQPLPEVVEDASGSNALRRSKRAKIDHNSQKPVYQFVEMRDFEGKAIIVSTCVGVQNKCDEFTKFVQKEARMKQVHLKEQQRKKRARSQSKSASPTKAPARNEAKEAKKKRGGQQPKRAPAREVETEIVEMNNDNNVIHEENQSIGQQVQHEAPNESEDHEEVDVRVSMAELIGTEAQVKVVSNEPAPDSQDPSLMISIDEHNVNNNSRVNMSKEVVFMQEGEDDRRLVPNNLYYFGHKCEGRNYIESSKGVGMNALSKREGFMRIDLSASTRTHEHQDTKILYVVQKGECLFSISGIYSKHEKGDVIKVPKNLRYKIKNIGQERVYLHFRFD